ncbi:alpha/beta-hydrolase [Xylariaceae sp. FL0255]|nr:alpha/beta-hydrolase [Xylariaceae sp. FL0255]
MGREKWHREWHRSGVTASVYKPDGSPVLPPLFLVSQLLRLCSLSSPFVIMILSLLAAASCCLISGIKAVPSPLSSSTSSPTVTVKNGTYFGLYSSNYDQDLFLGMAYAQKPVRFALAESLNTTWTGSKEATAYSPECIGYGGDDVGYQISEDCLYLNVIRPAGTKEDDDLPVAVWIHGGGLVMGGTADRRYNLSFIVENSVKQGTPMIGVSLNYRLQAFGFLVGKEAKEAGVANIGFRDQRLALHWVQENIAAFGGSPKKVTVWGESSGAESLTAQVTAYDGRDDKLFRGVIAESGYGSFFNRYTYGLNNSAAEQDTFNGLVLNTTCAPFVNTAQAIPCLSELDFAEINKVLNSSNLLGPWSPVIDGDFIVDHPSAQFKSGRFVKAPAMIGGNTDEGTSFALATGINTDEELESLIASYVGPDVRRSSGKSADEVAKILMEAYPNIQALGIPNLQTWPELITPNSTEAEELGLQYRRVNAISGDIAIHYPRRLANQAYSHVGVDSWAYRFNVLVNGVAEYVGATHFEEVAFVFDNVNGYGYATNPFANEPPSYERLASIMSSAWVNFVTDLDPNGKSGCGLHGVVWPSYRHAAQGIVWSVNGSYVEFDDFRARGVQWMIDNALDVFGF